MSASVSPSGGYQLSNSFFSASLADVDPEIAGAIQLELGRQRDEIELIASENIVSRAVLEAQGSVMTNHRQARYSCRLLTLNGRAGCLLYGCSVRLPAPSATCW